jgi:hypothetical protein
LSNVPLSEGVGGGRSQVFLSFLNAELKCSYHSFDIAQYFLISKLHDLQAGFFQISLFLFVLQINILLLMRNAIYLDDQAQFLAEKVCYVVHNSSLPVERIALHHTCP